MSFRLLTIASLLLVVDNSCVVVADDFAIETEIFSSESKQAQASNVTIFSDDKVYDFSLIPDHSVTVFDPMSKRFTVADGRYRIQASLTIDELIRFVATEQTRAADLDIELIRFAANPNFEIEFDESTGQLDLISPVWSYHVETTRIDDDQLDRYNEFAKWFTQLNALFRPIPPSIRMELNEQLAKRNSFPTRVSVEIRKNGEVLLRKRVVID